MCCKSFGSQWENQMLFTALTTHTIIMIEMMRTRSEWVSDNTLYQWKCKTHTHSRDGHKVKAMPDNKQNESKN